uniref:Uncharacterized protein n=1 Tax=Knipowitschia caucasica TaxID=637954 RepID=A0AAV2JPW7_KNICA
MGTDRTEGYRQSDTNEYGGTDRYKRVRVQTDINGYGRTDRFKRSLARIPCHMFTNFLNHDPGDVPELHLLRWWLQETQDKRTSR